MWLIEILACLTRYLAIRSIFEQLPIGVIEVTCSVVQVLSSKDRQLQGGRAMQKAVERTYLGTYYTPEREACVGKTHFHPCMYALREAGRNSSNPLTTLVHVII